MPNIQEITMDDLLNSLQDVNNKIVANASPETEKADMEEVCQNNTQEHERYLTQVKDALREGIEVNGEGWPLFPQKSFIEPKFEYGSDFNMARGQGSKDREELSELFQAKGSILEKVVELRIGNPLLEEQNPSSVSAPSSVDNVASNQVGRTL